MRAYIRIRPDGGLGAGPAWAVLREVVLRAGAAGCRAMMTGETRRFWPASGRCLLSASCPPPRAGIVCRASSGRSTWLFAERRRPGNLAFGFSGKSRRLATPGAEGAPQRRLCARREICAAVFLPFRGQPCRGTAASLLRQPLKGREVCCPGLHSRHLTLSHLERSIAALSEPLPPQPEWRQTITPWS